MRLKERHREEAMERRRHRGREDQRQEIRRQRGRKDEMK